MKSWYSNFYSNSNQTSFYAECQEMHKVGHAEKKRVPTAGDKLNLLSIPQQ
jgi:hypothetical protein